MSVRATNSLIADVVTVSAIPNSPKMVVVSVKEEAKLVDTVWFSASHEAQHATFPSQALDRVEIAKPAAKKAPASDSHKAAAKGKKK